MQTKFHECKALVEGGVELYVSKNLVDKPGAVIVIVHGVCEHSGRYEYVTSKLNSFGYSVYRFDNRGHGRSGGEKGYVENFNLFIDDAGKIVDMAKSENPNLPIFMLGHSMGGFITAGFGIKYPNRLTGQILSGAATIILPMLVNFEGVDFTPMARNPIPNSLSDQVSRDPKVIEDYKNDPLNLKEYTTWLMSEVFLRGARWLMDNLRSYVYPCLILHGGADEIVTPVASWHFHQHIKSKDKELKTYEGLYHEIMNEPEKDTVIEDVHAWIKKRI